MTLAFVITTIQKATLGVRRIAAYAHEAKTPFIVAGDRKTPDSWTCQGVTYLSADAQAQSSFAISTILPFNTYSRKLIGYLVAAQTGARWIRETDDDNSPYETFFAEPTPTVVGRTPDSPDRFINIYRFFTDRHIWPRGLPLDSVNCQGSISTTTLEITGLRVFQAVANGDPDVDAIYRLTAADSSDVTFDDAPPLIIPPGAWTPFNSQATTWPRELLPLMYLPSTCSFRMTDIWRSYVAQRLMPGLGATLVITGPMVYQDRNEHDLMRDFRDEIEGYVGYEHFVRVLETTPIDGGFSSLLSDLRGLYVALIEAGFFSSAEISILDAWIEDMESLGFGSTS